LEDSIEKMKASLLDLKEQIKKSDDKSLLDRVKYEGMISSQKE
jgi:hypothetical protein